MFDTKRYRLPTGVRVKACWLFTVYNAHLGRTGISHGVPAPAGYSNQGKAVHHR